eukprot:4193533-Prymnesium_polylepis.1
MDYDEEALVEAVRAAVAEKPGIGVKPLVKHLSENGWNVDSKAVRGAISAIAESKYVPAGRAGEAAIARAEAAAAAAAAAAAKPAAKPADPTSAVHNQRLQDIIN